MRTDGGHYPDWRDSDGVFGDHHGGGMKLWKRSGQRQHKRSGGACLWFVRLGFWPLASSLCA